MNKYEKINKVLKEIVDQLPKNDIINYEPIKCKCGNLIEPFFFGDKPLDRDVMQDCSVCGEYISFRPCDLKDKE